MSQRKGRGSGPLREESKRDSILRAVTDILESEGYDAVQLRVVAERAGASLRTIYRYFPTRDDLILAALEQWMAAHAYSGLAEPPAFASVYDGLMWSLDQIYAPWRKNPRMLKVFHRVRAAPGGERLFVQGLAAASPVDDAVRRAVDPAYAEELGLLIGLVAQAAIEGFVAGVFSIEDVMRTLERAVYRLTADNTTEIKRPQRSLRKR
jgi:AcrR family transcriptional regulator